jgi:GNAT superfamily N-acetyltransferase
MAGRLTAHQYSDEFAAELLSFDCGAEPYAVEVSEWIKGRPAEAKDSLPNSLAAGTRVWLYRDEAGCIVGYAALGATTWRWPPPDGEKQAMSILAWFGIDIRFHGQPDGVAREDRYSYQMMGHLITRARETGHEFLVLFVEAENDRAIRFYENVGFVRIDERKGYVRMALNLR